MQTKQFHLGDVLSVIAHRVVSPTGVAGLESILSFMTGEDIVYFQIPRATDECRPHLVEKFPQLTGEEMDQAARELTKSLGRLTDNSRRKEIVADWLAKMVSKHGEMFNVEPIPKKPGKTNFIRELVDAMGGPEKVNIFQY